MIDQNGMRILDDDLDKKIDSVTILLTRDELQQLIGYAKQIIENNEIDHCHVSSSDYQKEVTICIYDAKNYIGIFSPRIEKLIIKDE